MTASVGLIGVGGIGFRHFQGLLCSKSVDTIFVVDLNPSAIARCEEEIKVVRSHADVCFLHDIALLPRYLDILIIATSSRPRLSILQKLSERVSAGVMIVEKLVFSRPNDYTPGLDFINGIAVKSYVNCPLRIQSGFKSIKEALNDQSFEFVVSGESWGLACNGLHYIDLFAFLSDQWDFKYDSSEVIVERFFESKRMGYLEFHGVIKNRSGNSRLELLSGMKEMPLKAEIRSLDNKVFCTFDPSSGFLEAYIDGTRLGPLAPLKRQSDITGDLCDELVNNDFACGLTPLTDSVELHKSYLNPLYYLAIEEGYETNDVWFT